MQVGGGNERMIDSHKKIEGNEYLVKVNWQYQCQYSNLNAKTGGSGREHILLNIDCKTKRGASVVSSQAAYDAPRSTHISRYMRRWIPVPLITAGLFRRVVLSPDMQPRGRGFDSRSVTFPPPGFDSKKGDVWCQT